jgi:hypothetical protein
MGFSRPTSKVCCGCAVKAAAGRRPIIGLYLRTCSSSELNGYMRGVPICSAEVQLGSSRERMLERKVGTALWPLGDLQVSER